MCILLEVYRHVRTFCIAVFMVTCSPNFTDLLKHTDPSHSDHTSLTNAVEALKNVMT